MPRGGRKIFGRRSEGREASRTEGGDLQNVIQQQRDEGLQALHRMLLTPVRGNQRANETSEQHHQRMESERTRFLQEAGSLTPGTSGYQSFQARFAQEYMAKEYKKRGLKVLPLEDMDDNQRGAVTEIVLESEIITLGETTKSYDGMKRIIDEDAAFRGIVKELGFTQINRGSPAWQRFRVEAYEDIREKYKFEEHDGRSLMLADIMRVETDNRLNLSSIDRKEYKTMITITIREWQAWKSKNNILDEQI